MAIDFDWIPSILYFFMQFYFGTPYHINLQNETFAKVQYRPRYFQNIKNFVIYDRIEIFDPEQVHDFLE